jgi:hypothetical protein
MPQEIHSDDGKLDLGQQKRPLESGAAMEDEGKTALSPARNVKSICTRETRTGLLARIREGEKWSKQLLCLIENARVKTRPQYERGGQGRWR